MTKFKVGDRIVYKSEFATRFSKGVIVSVWSQSPNMYEVQVTDEQGTFREVVRESDISSVNNTVPSTVAEDGTLKSSVGSIPSDVLLSVGEVFTFGANKYYADKWIKEPTTAKKRVESSLRHTYKWLMGIDLDDESNLHHIDHAITQLMMAKRYINNDK